jgi:2-succinyl-5-enolpyruvyl-6-hydroxy-3-cyclohexene-1-carboxylate synthase
MNAQAQAARALLSSLADAGLTHAVISPGSRSTPLVLAALAEPRIAITEIIDERSAAFFALGRARVTGRPSLMITTSGTAGAHAYPAVIEAALAGVPLIVLTADRPLELQGCGALQTVDQRDLFGRHVRGAFELVLADNLAVERVAAQAFQAALFPEPGPVHLNVQARKPLEAEPGELRGRATPRFGAVRVVPEPAVIEELERAAIEHERGLIVAGPMPLSAAEMARDLEMLSDRTGWPILAEATSQLRFTGRRPALACDVFEPLLRSPKFRAEHEPSLILQLGAFPTSSGYEAYLSEHPRVKRVVIAAHGYPDPLGTASRIVACDPAEVLSRLSSRPRGKTAWAESFLAAEAQAKERVLAELERGEAAIAHEVVASARPGALVVAANGLPIRHLDLFAFGADVGVLSQRGASGIDGLLSGAAGAASASNERPVILLAGDVAALHDVSGLFAARRVEAPLAIVVIHNDGGRIFEMLPIGAHAASERFTTPHGTDFAHAAALFGVRFHSVEDRAELRLRLLEAQARPGATLIEARVDPHDARDCYARLFGRT